MRKGYIDCHECVDFAHYELPLCIFGKTLDTEVEPALGIDTMIRPDSILDAAETILYVRASTWNSDICLTSCMFPASKLQLRMM